MTVELKEIITEWTVAGSPGGLSIMYCGGGLGSQVQSRQAIRTAWFNFGSHLCVSTTATVRTSGRIIEDTTGELVGAWEDPTVQTMTGIGPVPSIPNASAALIRWRTDAIVGGRRLQGRTFVPGLSAASTGSGELTADARNDLGAASFLATTDSGLRIWSRPRVADPAATPPVAARVGTSADVTGSSGWNELAVVRNRR